MSSLLSLRTAKSAPARDARRCRPEVEALEDRALPANYFIFDFTPDGGGANFVDTFRNTKTSNGYAPNFLDFNGDRRITMDDVNLAANRIANKAYSHFSNWSGYSLKGYYGDISSNSNWGQQWVNWGKQYSGELVMVMYFGGASDAFGRSPVAPEGYNVEGTGMSYTQTIANWLVANRPSATPQDFADMVASTAAHEFGHMLGLRHATSGPTDNLMNTNRNRFNSGSHYFVNGSVSTEGGAAQNAYTELTASFRGQKTTYGNVMNDSPGEGLQHGDEFLPAGEWESTWFRTYSNSEGRISAAGFDAAFSRLGSQGSTYFSSAIDQAFAAGAPMTASERLAAGNLGGDVQSYDFQGLGDPSTLGPGTSLPEETSASPAPPTPATALPESLGRVILQRVRGRMVLVALSNQTGQARFRLGNLAPGTKAHLADVNRDGFLDLVIQATLQGRKQVQKFDGLTLAALGTGPRG